MGRRNRRREGAENPGPEPTEPHRENVPGEWDHSSGEEEVFEAGLVSGAEGEESDMSDEELRALAEGGSGQAQEALGRPEVAAASKPARAPRARAGTAKAPAPGAPTGGRGIGRIFAFFRASWAELQRVQWPDRRQVGQATAVVLGFVVIAGAYLGLADLVAKKVIDFIL